MVDTVIKAEGLSKQYFLGMGSDPSDLRSTIATAFRRTRRIFGAAADEPRNRQFWALRDIDFEITQGEVFGIIGRNGAGKSTLLKILARITLPTCGSAWVEGRVGSLLEVGTGFHPELSGRENTYLNAAILGMTREEIAQRYASIVEYAGIPDFMETPVKRYSSGMRVRLAFAIAAHIDPEILILDEVLNVGDVEFRRKSTATIFEFVNRGNTILFVSHDLESVRSMCTRVMYLKRGKICFLGDTHTAIDLYLQDLKEGANRNLLEVSRSPSITPVISAARLCNDSGDTVTGVPACGNVTLEIILDNNDELPEPHIDLHIRDSRGANISWIASRVLRGLPAKLPPHATVRVHLAELPLLPGAYFISIVLGSCGRHVDTVEHAAELQIVHADVFGTGQLQTNIRGYVIVRAAYEVADA